MSDQPSIASTAAPEKKKRKPQGPRTPQSFYLFMKLTPENPAQPAAIVKSFRNPHKMASYFPEAQVNGEFLVIATPEA